MSVILINDKEYIMVQEWDKANDDYYDAETGKRYFLLYEDDVKKSESFIERNTTDVSGDDKE